MSGGGVRALLKHRGAFVAFKLTYSHAGSSRPKRKISLLSTSLALYASGRKAGMPRGRMLRRGCLRTTTCTAMGAVTLRVTLESMARGVTRRKEMMMIV